MYCQVIIDIVHENVASPFTYRIPENMNLVPGQRVAVPFGRGRKEGILLSLSATCELDENRVKDILYPLEEYAAIPAELMQLAEQMACESHCPLAETLRLMLPAQMRGGRVHVRTERTAKLAVPPEEAGEAAKREKRSPKRAELLRILADGRVHSISVGRRVLISRSSLMALLREGEHNG